MLISLLRSLHIIAVHIVITTSWLGLLRRVRVAACKRLSRIGACSCISRLTSSHLNLSNCSFEWRRRTESHLSLHSVATSNGNIFPTLLMMYFLITGSSKQWDTIACLFPRATAFPIRFLDGVSTYFLCCCGY